MGPTIGRRRRPGHCRMPPGPARRLGPADSRARYRAVPPDWPGVPPDWPGVPPDWPGVLPDWPACDAGTPVSWRCPGGSRYWVAPQRQRPGPQRRSMAPAGAGPGPGVLPTPSRPGHRPFRTVRAGPAPLCYPAGGSLPAVARPAWRAARHHARPPRWPASAGPSGSHGPPRGGDSAAAGPPGRRPPDRRQRTRPAQVPRGGTARARRRAGTPSWRHDCRQSWRAPAAAAWPQPSSRAGLPRAGLPRPGFPRPGLPWAAFPGLDRRAHRGLRHRRGRMEWQHGLDRRHRPLRRAGNICPASWRTVSVPV